MNSASQPPAPKPKQDENVIRKLAVWLRQLTESTHAVPEKDRRQVRLLSLINLTLLMSVLLTIPVVLSVPGMRNKDELYTSAFLLILLLVSLLLSRTRHYRLAIYLTVLMTAVSVWFYALTDRSYSNPAPLDLTFVIVSVILSSMLLPARFTGWLSLAQLVGILLLPVFKAELRGSPEWETLLIFVGIMSTMTVFVAIRRQRDQEEIRHQSEGLAKSEAQFKSILENSPAAISLKDTQGRYMLVNRQYKALTPVDTQEIVGKTAADIYPQKNAESILISDQKVLQSGESLETEETFTENGEARDFIAVKFPLYATDGKLYGVGTIATDMTDRKRINEALRRSEERFRLVSYATNDAVWDWNLLTDERWWNQSIQRLFGYAVDQVGPKNDWWESQLHPEDREKVLASIKNAISGKEEFWSKEYRHRRADGSYAYVFDRGYIIRDENGVPVRMLGAIMDITLRKTMDDELAQEQYLLDVLLDNIPDAFYFKDNQSRFIRVGKALAAKFGKESNQVVGTTDFDYFARDYAEAAFQMEQRIIRTGQPVVDQETCEFWPDRPPTWASVTKMPLRDKNGKIVGTFGISRDITGRKQTEDALKEAHDKQTSYVHELEDYTRETALLNEMGDMLQTCPTVEEAYHVIAELARRLFPQEAGGLYMIGTSRDQLELAACWGMDALEPQLFRAEDCWGLRLGRLHVVDQGAPKDGQSREQLSLMCNHLRPNGPETYMCVPLAAQGEALGLMHIRYPKPGATVSRPPGEWFTESRQQFALSVAYRSALALANLKLRETLHQQSIRDPLTGLFNRRYMEESLEREMHRVIRGQHPLGVVMIDIDHFKHFNDTFGHEAGDAILRALGSLLRTKIRLEDIACRYGGEEFVLIMPDASLDVVQKRAMKLRDEVKHLDVRFNDRTLEAPTISVGVAAYPNQGPTGEAVLRAADAALYRAKKAGRDRVEAAEEFRLTSEPGDPEKRSAQPDENP